MTMQLSVAARNAMADALETAIGASPTLEIRTGAQPATCATADSGTVLATIACPADFWAAAIAGVKTLLGAWQDLSADATGTAAHFRLKQGGTCHMQGSVTAIGGGGDLTVNNTSFVITQQFDITAFTYTRGNA